MHGPDSPRLSEVLPKSVDLASSDSRACWLGLRDRARVQAYGSDMWNLQMNRRGALVRYRSSQQRGPCFLTALGTAVAMLGLCVLGMGVLGGCGSDGPEGQAVAIGEPQWPDASPAEQATFDFTKAEILERLVRKLSGSTTSNAWNFSKIVMSRPEDPELRAALINFASGQGLAVGETAPLRNAIEVMERSAHTAYSDFLVSLEKHGSPEIRDAAMKALIACADKKAVERFLRRFDSANIREQSQYLRIFAKKLDAARAARVFTRVIAGQYQGERLASMREQVLVALEQKGVPKLTIRSSMSENLGGYRGAQRLRAAKLLASAGGEQGRSLLVSVLRDSKSPQEKAMAILALAETAPEEALPHVVGLSLEENPVVQEAVATLLGRVQDENAVRTLEVMSSFADRRVHLAALRGLKGRGVEASLGRSLEGILVDTGTGLRQDLEDVIQAGSPAAVKPIRERLAKTRGSDRRPFLHALGMLRRVEAVPVLLEEFARPPVLLSKSLELDSVSYSMLMIANIPGAELELWPVYERLSAAGTKGPSAAAETKERALRRAHVLSTLARLAMLDVRTPEGIARGKAIYQRFRELVRNPATPERERLLVLSMLKPDLRVADALWLKRLLRKEKTESSTWRRKLNDFLSEYF